MEKVIGYDIWCKKNGESFDAGYGEYIVPEEYETPIQAAIHRILYREVWNSPNATYFESCYGTDKKIRYFSEGKEIESDSTYYADTLMIDDDIYTDFDIIEDEI